MATKPSGIAGLNTNTRTYLDTVAGLRTTEAQRAIQPSPDMKLVRQRQAEYANYLGQTDYAKQLEESQNMGKLQLALALAQRGFAAAGATPKRGESSVSTLSRELLSPLAGDAGSVAGRMMQQKQAINAAKTAEERQLKLAALQKVDAENTRLGDLTLQLMPKPKTAGEKAPFESVKYIVRRTSGVDGEPDTFGFTGSGGAAVQVRQERGVSGQLGSPLNVIGGKPVALEPGDEIVTFANLPDNLKGIVAKTSGSTASLGTVDYRLVYDKGPNKGKPFQANGRTPIFGTITKAGLNLPLGALVERGRRGKAFDSEEIKKLGLRVEKIVKPAAATGPTDADRKITANRDLLFTSMNRIQNQQLDGANTPYSAKSALYFDLAAYRRGEFSFKFVPPGTKPLEAAAKSVTITNPRVQKFITKKVNSLADATLRTDFGSANQEIKPARLNDAVKAILSLSPAALFGAEAIPDLGTDARNNPVGYVPGAGALDPALQREVVKTAVRTLKTDPTANPTETYSGIAFPVSKEALNKTPNRVRIATELFPEAFGDPEVAGKDSYVFGLVQQRRDIEAAIPRATLVIGASNDDYRKVLTDGAAKISAARDKLQNSKSARDAKDSFLLFRQFREGLLDFKNAARESGVEGFFTGRIAAGLSRLGLDKFIAGEGAEHWRRLTAASDRFQEGISRRVGKDFGDDRISNLDAAAYQKLVADIKKGAGFNRVLVEGGLSRIKNNMTDLMSRGGRVGWTERELRQASEAGVDFSELKTMENWHGHGYYGKDRFAATRQQTPSLSQNQRDVIRTQGQLKDTMYGGQYTVPDVNYLTDTLPTFQRAREETSEGPAIPATRVLRKGPVEFQKYIESLARSSGVSEDVIRKRVVRGIISYNTFREQVR